MGAVLAAHVVAPALPAIALDFATTARTMQMAVSIYVAGLAVGQLVYGPLAERFGERHVLMGGLSLYVLASVGAAVAHGASMLIAIRLAQSLGGAAGLVLARAIARHGVDAREATRRLALMNLMITLGPAIAPLIGSGVTAAFGWRFLFLGLAMLGAANMVGTWVRIPPSRLHAVEMRTVLRNYLALFTTPAFVGYSLSGACLTTSMYAIIGTAPFILVGRFHIPIGHVGLVLALATVGIWLGSMTASRLVRAMSVERLLTIGGVCVAAAAFALLLLVLEDLLTVGLLIADIALFLFGVGLSGPPALALAMAATPRAAALAHDPAYGAAVTVCIASTLGLVGVWATRRQARPLPG